MRLNRHAVGVFAASATLLVGGGAALAASAGGDRGSMCEQRLAKIAENRGVSVEQLQADIKARLLARIDAAEKGRPDLVRACDEAPQARLGGKPLRSAQSRQGSGSPLVRCSERRRNSSTSTVSSFALSCRAPRSPGSRRSRGRAPRRSRPRWWRLRRRGWPKRSRTRSSRRRRADKMLAKFGKVPSGSRRPSSPRSRLVAATLSNDDEALCGAPSLLRQLLGDSQSALRPVRLDRSAKLPPIDCPPDLRRPGSASADPGRVRSLKAAAAQPHRHSCRA